MKHNTDFTDHGVWSANRYADELVRREQQQQQQQQQQMMVAVMQDGEGVTSWNYQNGSRNSVASSSSPETPPRKRRRATTSPVTAPLVPADKNTDDIRPPASTPRDLTVMTSSSGHHVVDSSAMMGHVLATQFACPCPHCRDSKPTYIVPLDFVSAAQLQHRSTAQI